MLKPRCMDMVFCGIGGKCWIARLDPQAPIEEPQDGLFVWARLTGAGAKIRIGAELAQRAIEMGVAFVPGTPFYAAIPDPSTLRLNFATADVAKIKKWVGRLAQALG